MIYTTCNLEHRNCANDFLFQFFSPQFIQSMVLVGENNIYNIFKAEKQFILNGSISLVAKKSNESNVTDIKLDINGEFFPSIMTVSPFLLNDPSFLTL